MFRKEFCLGNSVFSILSEIPVAEVKRYTQFHTTNDNKDYIISVDEADDDEETPGFGGYIRLIRKDNHFLLKIKKERLTNIDDDLIFSMIPIVRMLLEKGAIILHASYVLYKDKAILFCGPCQIGKSTQAQLWEENRGAEIVNGDRTLIFAENGILYASGYFACGTSGICKNRTVPIAAIVLLEQDNENRVSTLKSSENLKRLLVQCSYNINDSVEVDMVIKLLLQIIEGTKVLHFSCRKDISAVEELEKYL